MTAKSSPEVTGGHRAGRGRSAALGFGVSTACLVAAQLGPALTAIGPVRVLTPALSGVGDRDHVALTFDDGPDPRSTPAFLRLLREHEVNATFFLLGEMLARSPALGRRLVESGHEVAVHGWDHRCLAWRTPRSTYEGLARARDLIATRTGCVPRWFRPPYGVLTLAALQAARRLDLTPVLWTSWGRDWTGRATAESVLAAATRGVAGGGVVLLHDSTGGYAAPGAWRATLGALPGLVEHCRRHELGIGRLDEHGLAREPRSGGTRRGRARS